MEVIKTVLWYAAMGYGALVIAKTILVLDQSCLAASILHRLNKGTHSKTYYLVSLAITVPFVVLVTAPFVLAAERGRFFLAYTPRRVMRELLAVHREAE